MVFTTPPPPRPKLNKAARAKLAKETINTTVPQILKSNERAQKGSNATKLIQYIPTPYPPPSTPPSHPLISVIKSDTLTAAKTLRARLPASAHLAILNMASPLRPGGGVLSGARAQEESLCMRSTLYPSLDTRFYRLPETGALFTPDVLVFRLDEQESPLLPKSEWFYVDVISCPAVRKPEVDVKAAGEGELEGKGKGLAKGEKEVRVYAEDKDREAMVVKVRLILQIAKEKGIEYLVLGALGCGAYGNPPGEVARIFKKVICGDRKRGGLADGIKEIVFAIFDEGENLDTFTEVFSDVMS